MEEAVIHFLRRIGRVPEETGNENTAYDKEKHYRYYHPEIQLGRIAGEVNSDFWLGVHNVQFENKNTVLYTE